MNLLKVLAGLNFAPELATPTISGLHGNTYGDVGAGGAVLQWGVSRSGALVISAVALGIDPYDSPWMSGGGTPGDLYEVRLVKNSGNDPSSGPALNTWHALSTDRSWQYFAAAVNLAGNFTLAIGGLGTSTALASATFNLEATGE